MKRQQKIGVLSAFVALTVGSFGALQMAQATDYTAGDTITIDNGIINVKNMTMKERDKSLAVGYNNTLSGVDSVVIGTKNTVANSDSATVGYDNLNYGFSSAILGHGNFTIGEYSAAIGFSNGARGNQSSAVGYSNVANGANSSAFGRNNGVYGVSTSAVGDSNDVYGANSAAFGKENTVGHGDYDDDLKFVIDDKGNNSYVVGASNQVMANKAFVVGAGNQIGDVTQEGAEAQDANVFVLGSNNNFTAQNAIVIGSSVTTVANNSVVLGEKSASTEENTVSVGNADTQRRIVNVKSGTKEHEAATWDQLINGVSYNADTGELKLTTNNSSTYTTLITTSGSGDGKTYQAGTGIKITDSTSTTPTISVKTDGKVESGNAGIVTGGVVYDAISDMTGDTAKLSAAGLGDNVTDSILSVNDKVGNLSNDIHKVGAGAAALAALHPEGFDPSAKWSFAVGYGHYKNANAGAFGAFFQPNADTTLSLGSTIGNGSSMLNAGLSFKIGQRSAKLPQNASNPQLVQEVNALRAENAAQAQEIRELKAQMARVLAKIGG